MAKETNKQNEVNVEEAISKTESFIQKNQKNILIGVAALILIVVGAIWYGNHTAAVEEEAAQTMFRAEQLFNAGEYERALNGDSLGTVGFKTVASDYSSTKVGNLAKAYAGLSLAQMKKYAEAVEYLDDFSGDDAIIAPAVLGALGNCYAQLGQEEKAASTLMKAADKADNNSLSPVYLLQAGQIYEKLGKNSDAVKAYKQIKEKYVQSMQAYDIDKYIERASVK